MTTPHTYWHIYGHDQLRPAIRGRLIYVLEVPWTMRSPIIRAIYDPTGRDFPDCPQNPFSALLHPDHHGVLYAGIRKQAAYDLMLSDPPLADRDYARYNAGIILNARNFFLQDPNQAFKAMPQHMAQLL